MPASVCPSNAHGLPAALSIFLLLTFALSAIFWALVVSAGSIRAGGGALVLGLMWCPGVAVLITVTICRHSVRGLGWSPRRWRYLLAGHALSLLYAVLACCRRRDLLAPST